MSLKLTPEVIDAINAELEYIDNLPARGLQSDEKINAGLTGELVKLLVYANRAQDAFIQHNGTHGALNHVRKCAAIACRAMLVHGVCRR